MCSWYRGGPENSCRSCTAHGKEALLTYCVEEEIGAILGREKLEVHTKTTISSIPGVGPGLQAVHTLLQPGRYSIAARRQGSKRVSRDGVQRSEAATDNWISGRRRNHEKL